MIGRGRLSALVVLGCIGLFGAVLLGMVRPEDPAPVDRIELRPERISDAKDLSRTVADNKSGRGTSVPRKGNDSGKRTERRRNGGDDDGAREDDAAGALGSGGDDDRNEGGTGPAIDGRSTNPVGSQGGDDDSLGGDDSGDDGGDDD